MRNLFLAKELAVWSSFTAASIYFLSSLVMPVLHLNPVGIPPEPNIEEAALNFEIKPFAIPLGRNIFKTMSGEVDTNTTTASGIDQDEQDALTFEFIKNLSLVGIVSGQIPQAAIEDKQNLKTYYVTEGQYIQGVHIKDIQDTKVILKYKEQRFDLYL